MKKAINIDDVVFDVVNHILLTIVLLIIIYPLYFVVIASISSPLEVLNGNVFLTPKDFNLDAYKMIFRDSEILTGYRNTIFYTVTGTFINLFMTIFAAYPLSRKDWVGRKFFTYMLAFTMFFSGGLIPTYILISKLKMINTVWAMLIPGAVSVWNVIIMRTYFNSSIPDSLTEAAFVDGCSNIKLLFRIIIPLSRPVIAVMVLFYGVGHWNSFFSALIYINSRELFPLQLVLRELLIQNQFSEEMLIGEETMLQRQLMAESIKYGLIIVASAPIIAIYPLIQKHFVKGIMVGSIKG
ncbi:MAG: carbohydrate ABC transporter permease [Clostridiaceae bacterium]|nr:carbohydrate ABC transporter permease [Clostridiaceae bacterium]